jgi:hypothetical protein
MAVAKEVDMRRHHLLRGGVVAAALALAGTALAAAPWPGLARSVSNGELRYVAGRASGQTTIRAMRGSTVVRSRTIAGEWGIPAVTMDGDGGGLSPDGRRLVLVELPNYQYLRRQSHVVLLSTADLRPVRRIALKGEFGFDALSPDGHTLYLLQHANRNDFIQYLVRAYDLRSNGLARRVIVDKREPDEKMVGWPVARATSATGGWVYTLYQRQQGEPFVHALDANHRGAFCIDLPEETKVGWDSSLTLSADEATLTVRTRRGETATIDTQKLEVR